MLINTLSGFYHNYEIILRIFMYFPTSHIENHFSALTSAIFLESF